MKENEVFVHGKLFSSIEKAIAYDLKWRDSPFDAEEYKKFLETRFREAELNKKMNPEFTNRMAYALLRTNTDWVERKD